MPEVRLLGEILAEVQALQRKQDHSLARLAAIERMVRIGSSADAERLYTRCEEAQLIGVTARTVDRHIRAGRLRAIRQGRRVLITGASIQGQRQIQRRAAVEVLSL